MWEDFLKKEEARLGKEVVEKWLRPLKILHEDPFLIALEAENPFQVAFFQEHVKPKLLHQKKPKITLSLKGAHKTHKKEEAPAIILEPDPLNPLSTLENFLLTPNNQFPFQFLSQLKIPPLYNPIYLYGAPGSGKTHLLHALAQFYTSQGLKALYVKAETFTEHVVLAMRNSSMQLFRKHYRSVDMLLFDDVPVLARKTATQEEFFHTFNTLHMEGKQILLSSHLPQRELQEIEPRLTSRFEWGMTFALEPLKEEELPLLLEQKVQALSLPLSKTLKCFLLKTFLKTSSLQLALEALSLRCHLKQIDPETLNQKTLEHLLEDLIQKEQEAGLSFEKVVLATSHFYGIATHAILGSSHAKELVTARHVAIYLCRELLKLPFTKLGALFSRDHSTAIASVKLIEKKIEEKEGDILKALTEIKALAER